MKPIKGRLLAALAVGLALGFLTWLVTISIGPLSEWTQELGACRGAEKIERDVEEGEALSRGPGGGNSTTTVSTTTFEMRCTFDDGREELVENDEAVVKGMLVGFLIGFVPGFLGWLAYRAVRPPGSQAPPSAPAAGA